MYPTEYYNNYERTSFSSFYSAWVDLIIRMSRLLQCEYSLDVKQGQHVEAPRTISCGNSKNSSQDFCKSFISQCTPLSFTNLSHIKHEIFQSSMIFMEILEQELDNRIVNHKCKNTDDFPENTKCQGIHLCGASMAFTNFITLPSSFQPATLFSALHFFFLFHIRRKKIVLPLVHSKVVPFPLILHHLEIPDSRILPTSISLEFSYREVSPSKTKPFHLPTLSSFLLL